MSKKIDIEEFDARKDQWRYICSSEAFNTPDEALKALKDGLQFDRPVRARLTSESRPWRLASKKQSS